MVVEEIARSNDLLKEQVDRIVRSEEFRSAEVLRRLLQYLAEKVSSGEADKLKEYVVAIEGLGKPSSYDPQHNSAVRIQVGRLRQKLAEYYRNEGINDPLYLDLPKGRFRLVCETRKAQPDIQVPLESPPPMSPARMIGAVAPPAQRRQTIAWMIAAVALLSAAMGFGAHSLLGKAASGGAAAASVQWTPEIETLWSSFVNSKRPLLVLTEDPLFVELHSTPGVYYRDRSMNKWSDIEHSQTMQSLSKTLNSSGMQPSRYYTAFGEVQAAFQLGRLLGPRASLFS